MKKTVFALFLTIIAISFAFAGDVLKVLSVYSGSQCTTIPLASIDSLDHSMYDPDGKLHEQYISSVIHAIDSDYQIPINSIDKIVIDEIDDQQFQTQISEIGDFINSQTELKVDDFQENLLTWLNAKENIQEATIDEDKNLITIKFNNGLDFYINFFDLSYYDVTQNEAKSRMINASTNEKPIHNFYNVAYEDKEEIIESPNILYIKGMDMVCSPLWTVFEDYTPEEYERNGIEESMEKSPVEFNMEYCNESLDFVKKDFSKYGLIFVSQTHGGGSGSFMVTRLLSPNPSIFNPLSKSSMGFLIYTDNIADISETEMQVVKIPWVDKPIYSIPVYLVQPTLFKKKMKGKNETIVYCNYCWSAKMKNYIRNNTIIGFETKTMYHSNWGYTLDFVENMFMGSLCSDFIKKAKPFSYDEAEGGIVIPSTNHPDSKQRYFSISTDEITETGENGQPIISGKINGYDNLKKDDLTFLVYFHQGDGELLPEYAKDEECMILKTPGVGDVSEFKITEDGSFSFEFPGFLLSNTKYQMIFAFEYKDNYYYGESKYVVPEEKDNTISDGELVDLGLNVKWASCNVGAEKPNQLGTMIKIDIISEAYKSYPGLFTEDATKADFCKSEYDIAYKQTAGRMRMPTYEELKELKERCTWELSVIDGVAGARIVGPNKNSIFLPAATELTEQPYFGDSYMLNRTVYTSGTYDNNIGWGPMTLYISGMYMPQLAMASTLLVELGNDFNAYIRPVGD